MHKEDNLLSNKKKVLGLGPNQASGAEANIPCDYPLHFTFCNFF